MSELPPDHIFPDGDRIHYWKDEHGVVWGQLLKRDRKSLLGKPWGRKFKFLGDQKDD